MNAFAADARKFWAVLGSVILQSAPHIYLSALPFAPEVSIISKLCLPQFPFTLFIQTGKPRYWPALQKALQGFNIWFSSVIFSSDNKRVVSGLGDGTIMVWDMETGGIISSPVIGHTAEIFLSIAISHDGLYRDHLHDSSVGCRHRRYYLWALERP